MDMIAQSVAHLSRAPILLPIFIIVARSPILHVVFSLSILLDVKTWNIACNVLIVKIALDVWDCAIKNFISLINLIPKKNMENFSLCLSVIPIFHSPVPVFIFYVRKKNINDWGGNCLIRKVMGPLV